MFTCPKATRKLQIFSLSLSAIALSACGGGSDARGHCASINGPDSQLSSDCVGCDIERVEAAADGDLLTAAIVEPVLGSGHATMTLRATSHNQVFPAGSYAGVFYTPENAVCNNCTVTVNTYLNGAAQESRSGVTNQTNNGAGASYYTGMQTLLPFDAVEIVNSGTVSPIENGRLISVYEICSDGSF